ncbi:MAG: hypothetical protein JW863_10375 [Chitinispirillaceae bacterium]|nr:hypothetical protein [Chitinispirillaceae bacterium]
MVKHLKTFVVFIPVFCCCNTASISSDWASEWEFQNMEDSTYAFKGLEFNIGNSMYSTRLHGAIDTSGRLIEDMLMPGFRDEVLDENP